MRKVIVIFLVVMCTFSFIAFANAEELWSSMGTEGNIIDDLIEGKASGDNVNAFFEKYDVYYTYIKIEDGLYKNYISDKFNGTATGATDTINSLVPTIDSVDTLSSWTKVSDSKITFSDLEYDSSKDTGYIVAVAAVSKDDNSKIYVYRGVYETTSTTTVVNSYDKHYNDTNSSSTQTSSVTTNDNPNTGINDYMMFLVPLSLVLGSVLLMRKRYV